MKSARAAAVPGAVALVLGLAAPAASQNVIDGQSPPPAAAPPSAPAAPDDEVVYEIPAGANEVTVLKSTVLIRSLPRMDSEQLGYVAALRPITRQQTTLPVLERREVEGGRTWLKVRTPGRGTKRTGWIPSSAGTMDYVGWRVEVDRSERRAKVFYLGRVRKTFRVIVGKPNTPTPKGSFFVEENIREPRSHGIGPYAIALSARSGVYREFEGGPGQIALHGQGTLPGALGSAASHGCIRFADSAINWLGERIDAGSTVVVRD